MSWGGTAIQAVAAGVSAYTQVRESREKSKAMKRNAQLAAQEADVVEQRSREEADLYREKIKRMASSRKTSYARSGVKIEGSPLATFLQTMEDGNLDALSILAGGSADAVKLRNQGRSLYQQSSIVARQGLLTGGINALKSASKFSDAYDGYKKESEETETKTEKKG